MGVQLCPSAGRKEPDSRSIHAQSGPNHGVLSAAPFIAGLTVNTPFWNTLTGLCMWLGRFVPIVAVLALAGRFASAQAVPAGAGTLPTHLLTSPGLGYTLVP